MIAMAILWWVLILIASHVVQGTVRSLVAYIGITWMIIHFSQGMTL